MLVEEYWNNVGSTKHFEDPLYLDKLSQWITKSTRIVEYGCGYGRLLKIFKADGYENLVGFDFAPNMIQRGKKENPDLDLRLLKENRKIPLPDQSADALVMSTVLCTLIEKEEQTALIQEIRRILKDPGIFYLSDFLVCAHPRYLEKYTQGLKQFGVWGMYTTNEDLIVRHYSTEWILQLLADFDIQWFEQFDFKTMNQNPARTFHCIAKKSNSG